MQNCPGIKNFMVQVHYTVDGVARTHNPRSVHAYTKTEAKTIVLGNFAKGRDGKRIVVTGCTVH